MLIAFAGGLQLAFSQAAGSFAGEPTEESISINPQRASLNGSLESNDGKLRLNLTNGSAIEFRGFARIGLGSDSDQREIGQVDLTLPPQETQLLRLSGVAASGSHYTLTIYDARGTLVFYKIAPLKQISDPTPEKIVTLTPIAPARSKSNSSSNTPGPTQSSTAAGTINHHEPASASPEVQVQARLLASETETDQFILAFELSSPHPVYNATLAINAGKHKESKPVSINLQSALQFKMPDQPATEPISYLLTHKSGRVLARGEIDLGELMLNDTVTMTDIRTDRASYDPGDSVKLTFVPDGKSPHGCRIEIAIKDSQGSVIFRDQKQFLAGERAANYEVTAALPRTASPPVLVEFKIFDGENGILFDSGEREIPINEKGKKP